MGVRQIFGARVVLAYVRPVVGIHVQVQGAKK